MSKPSLVEQAKAVPGKAIIKFSPEHYDLAVAFIYGEVSVGQVSEVLHIPTGSVAYYMNKMLQEAVANNYATIRVNKK